MVGLAAFLVLSSEKSSTPMEERGFSLRNFFPFGNPETDFVETQNTNEEEVGPETNFTNDGETKLPKLRKISNEPVAGAVLLNSGSTTIVRFVYKSTGNVYEARSDSSTISRITNTTIPKINRAIWLPDGSGFLTQKAGESGFVETSYIRLRSSTATSSEITTRYETVTSNLPSDIEEIAPSPDSKKIFYYTAEAGMKGFLANPDGTNPSLVYSGTVAEWTIEWFGTNSILLTTKASFGSESFGYLLNPTNKSTSKIFGGIMGGSALTRGDGKYILTSSGGSSPFLLSINTASSETAADLLVKTFSEKCAWKGNTLFLICGIPKVIPSGNYPDAWYQGILSTNDFVDMIDIERKTVTPISDPEKETDEKINVDKMMISKDGRYASFLNKEDQSLWLLEI